MATIFFRLQVLTQIIKLMIIKYSVMANVILLISNFI